jgi:hypothetical protein
MQYAAKPIITQARWHFSVILHFEFAALYQKTNLSLITVSLLSYIFMSDILKKEQANIA